MATKRPTTVDDPTGATKLNWYGIELSLAMDSLEKMLEAVTNAIVNEQKRFTKELNKANHGRIPNQDDQGDEKYSLFELVPNEMRKAILVAIYGIIEYEAHNLCKIMFAEQKAKSNPKSEQDLKASIEFLRKETQLGATVSNINHQMLEGMTDVRNGIAHNGGHFPSTTTDRTKKETLDFIKATEGLDLENDQIRVSEKVCAALINEGLQFLKKLSSSAEDLPHMKKQSAKEKKKARAEKKR